MFNVEPNRILIIKPSSLGDIIHALPTLAVLRSRFPDASITWLVKSEWAEILDGNPNLNEVLSVNFDITKWPSLIRMLRGKGFDLVIDLQGLLRSALLAKLSGASIVVGFAKGREGSPWFYSHQVPLLITEGKSWRSWDMHAVDRNLCVAKFLGANLAVPQFWLPNHDDDQKIVCEWLHESGVRESDRLVAMAPMTRHAIKNWPVEQFIKVAQSLVKFDQVKVLLIGTKDTKVSRLFEQVLGTRVVNFMGKTRVRQLSAVFDRVELLIANDSAPLHIAVARGRPIVAIFGPTNPKATGPYGFQHSPHLLTYSLPCRPCGERVCRNAKPLECLTSISVQEVLRRAEDILFSRDA